jgi:ribosome-binding factor A
MHGLRHAAGFVQSRLAKRLQTRFTPVLHFVLDEGVKKSIEMTRLINEALGQSATPAAAEPEAEETPSPSEPTDGSAAQDPGGA